MSDQNPLLDDQPEGKEEAYEHAERQAIALLDQGFISAECSASAGTNGMSDKMFGSHSVLRGLSPRTLR